MDIRSGLDKVPLMRLCYMDPGHLPSSDNDHRCTKERTDSIATHIRSLVCAAAISHPAVVFMWDHA